jgi:hypothetical protein
MAGRFDHENHRLDSLLLAEKGAGSRHNPIIIKPMPEKIAGDGGKARISVSAPIPNSPPKIVCHYERDYFIGNFEEPIWRCGQIACRAAAIAYLGRDAAKVPITGWLGKWVVDDGVTLDHRPNFSRTLYAIIMRH